MTARSFSPAVLLITLLVVVTSCQADSNVADVQGVAVRAAASPQGKPGFVYLPGGAGLLAVDLKRPRIRTEVALPFGAGTIEVPPDNGSVWVAHGANGISIIDFPSHVLVAHLDVPASGIGFSGDGRFAYVTSGPSLRVIDTETLQTVDQVELTRPANLIAVHPAGRVAYVALRHDYFIFAVDFEDNTVREVWQHFSEFYDLRDLFISPDGSTVVAGSGLSVGNIIIDTETEEVVLKRDCGDAFRGAFHPDGTVFYFTYFEVFCVFSPSGDLIGPSSFFPHYPSIDPSIQHTGVAISPDGFFLATGGAGGRVSVATEDGDFATLEGLGSRELAIAQRRSPKR